MYTDHYNHRNNNTNYYQLMDPVTFSNDGRQQQQQYEQSLQQQQQQVQRPEHIYYDIVERYFQNSIRNTALYLYDRNVFDTELRRLSKQYNNFPYSSLQSMVRNLHVQHIKRTSYKLRNSILKYCDQYTRQGLSIYDIAIRINYSPYLLARAIVQEITILRGGGGNNSTNDDNNTTTTSSSSSIQPESTTIAKQRCTITMAMKDPLQYLNTIEILKPKYRPSEQQPHYTSKSRNSKPTTNPSENDETDTSVSTTTAATISKSKKQSTTTTTTRLAREVYEIIQLDPLYGPYHDKERHLIGFEYEIVLEHKLKQLGIPFETEKELRNKGSSRTPDVLLNIPLGVEVPSIRDPSIQEWKIIQWIDSKALFGDVHTHETTVLPQAESYVHRFGPGMVLYWFGHAPLHRLNTSQGDVTVIGWDLPTKFMFPTGDIVNK